MLRRYFADFAFNLGPMNVPTRFPNRDAASIGSSLASLTTPHTSMKSRRHRARCSNWCLRASLRKEFPTMNSANACPDWSAPVIWPIRPWMIRLHQAVPDRVGKGQ